MPFACDSIEYLGHVTAPGKLHIARHTTEAIVANPYPTTASQMRLFIGLCNVYSRFVSELVKVAAPLSLRLKKGKRLHFDFGGEERSSINELKSA